MATRLTLVSHAATPAMRQAAFPGDEAIEDKERARAVALGSRLRHADRVWTSPALRARQTAEALGLVPVPVSDLCDCDYGAWTGRSLGDLHTEAPDAVAAWLSDASAAPHGGESILDVLGRVGRWLGGWQTPGRTIAITHAAIIRAAVLHVLNAPPPAFWRIDAAPLTVTELSWNNGVWTLRSTGVACPE